MMYEQSAKMRLKLSNGVYRTVITLEQFGLHRILDCCPIIISWKMFWIGGMRFLIQIIHPPVLTTIHPNL